MSAEERSYRKWLRWVDSQVWGGQLSVDQKKELAQTMATLEYAPPPDEVKT